LSVHNGSIAEYARTEIGRKRYAEHSGNSASHIGVSRKCKIHRNKKQNGELYSYVKSERFISVAKQTAYYGSVIFIKNGGNANALDKSAGKKDYS
jgi:hypothetical protein